MTAVQPRTIIVREADRVGGSLRQPCGKSAREIASARERSCKGRGTFVVVFTGIVASENWTANFGEALQSFTLTQQKENLDKKKNVKKKTRQKENSVKKSRPAWFKPTGRIGASDRRQACYGQICTVRQR